MAQLSIYDKIRHHSEKDFTCSVGQRSQIYITFRNDSWRRFTSGDMISVYVTENKALKFGDPSTDSGEVFKLCQAKHGTPEVYTHTRYLRISGNAHPSILEVVTRTAGSYDFSADSIHMRAPKKQKKKAAEIVEEVKTPETIPGDIARLRELEARISALEVMVARVAACFASVPVLETVDQPTTGRKYGTLNEVTCETVQPSGPSLLATFLDSLE